jgi:hypothetical protein
MWFVSRFVFPTRTQDGGFERDPGRYASNCLQIVGAFSKLVARISAGQLLSHVIISISRIINGIDIMPWVSPTVFLRIPAMTLYLSATPVHKVQISLPLYTLYLPKGQVSLFSCLLSGRSKGRSSLVRRVDWVLTHPSRVPEEEKSCVLAGGNCMNILNLSLGLF